MHALDLLTTIAAAFAAAWVLGMLTHALRLSPIVGYLLAGVLIGPYTPGFVADVNVANQLAEVGVILLMFGVGLNFHIKDLLAVKSIAIPGALVQSFVATLVTLAVFHLFGWPTKASLVLGMAMAVASTVVLLRVLMDREMLNTIHGHIAVGWLIIEDILTVLMLVIVPMLSAPAVKGGDVEEQTYWNLAAIGWAVVKLAALVVVVLLGGSRIVPWILTQVARMRSRELFTLTVLVLSVTLAVGAGALFGASVALGAFLAGIVVGQSPVSHQAAADALPMRDAFAVLFFVSVGMMFDPSFIVQQPLMVAAGLAIVMLVKPITALFIVALLGYSLRSALTVAIGLAQIGEFSFILWQVARLHDLIPEPGHHVLVATAIISITLNPLAFAGLDRLEDWLTRHSRRLGLPTSGAQRKMNAINAATESRIAASQQPLAVIVGYGPTGRVVDALLRDSGMETVIVDMNMDTVRSLSNSGRAVIYGDATRREILRQAGVGKAVHLILALPHSANRAPLVMTAKDLNRDLNIIVRARFLAERDDLKQAGATDVIYEEGEAAVALARRVMEQRGLERQTIDKMLDAIRRLWRMHE
jgi:CPA2 family monovalent cation:H+ antiporter-2